MTLVINKMPLFLVEKVIFYKKKSNFGNLTGKIFKMFFFFIKGVRRLTL